MISKYRAQLPIGDRLAEFSFFPLPGSGIVLDEGVAEQGGARVLEATRRSAAS